MRWHRVGRVAMLVVLATLLYLYLSAGRSYLAARSQAGTANAQLATLERQNAELIAQRAALNRPGMLEEQARVLGMVRPGEQAYVIRGLPKN